MRKIIMAILSSTLLMSCISYLNHKAKKMRKEGYFNKNHEWISTPSVFNPTPQQMKIYNSSFNRMDTVLLKKIENLYDSTVLVEDCFKFIHNSDTTKFIALFMRKDQQKGLKSDPTYLKIVRSFGITQSHSSYTIEDSLSFIGFPVWGIRANNIWCFWRDCHYSCYNFEASSTQHAQKKLEHYILVQDVNFFNGYLENDSFWQTGGKHGRFLKSDSIKIDNKTFTPVTKIEREYRKLKNIK